MEKTGPRWRNLCATIDDDSVVQKNVTLAPEIYDRWLHAPAHRTSSPTNG
jgi:hypothetical protein